VTVSLNGLRSSLLDQYDRVRLPSQRDTIVFPVRGPPDGFDLLWFSVRVPWLCFPSVRRPYFLSGSVLSSQATSILHQHRVASFILSNAVWRALQPITARADDIISFGNHSGRRQ